MRITPNASLWIAALSLAMLGCDKPGPITPPPAASTAVAGPEPSPSEAMATATPTPTPTNRDVFNAEPVVLAKVAGRTITADELQAVLERQRRENRSVRPDRLTLEKTLNEMIDVALLAETARAEGISQNAEFRHEADRVVAQMLIEAKLAPEAKEAVSDADIDAYFAEKRRAGRLAVDSEDKAKAMARAVTEAIATGPEAATKVFAAFRAELGRKERIDAARGTRVFFHKDGKDELGRAVVPAAIAAAAFELEAVNTVSAPVKMGEGWALVQLLEIKDAVADALRTPTQIDAARKALVQVKLDAARREFVARLRREASVTVDQAKLDAFKKSSRSRKTARKLPFDIKKWRKNQLRGRRMRDPALQVKREDLQYTTEEILEKMKPKTGEESGQ